MAHRGRYGRRRGRRAWHHAVAFVTLPRWRHRVRCGAGGRGRSAMRGAWRADDVRVAEDRLMATVPPGTLMQRAAAGLARRCAELLGEAGGVYGARVVL